MHATTIGQGASFDQVRRAWSAWMPFSKNRQPVATIGKRIAFSADEKELMVLVDIAGSELKCLQGTLWVTQEDRPKDITWTEGESTRIVQSGKTLVYSITATRFVVSRVR